MNLPAWLAYRGHFLRARALWAIVFAVVGVVVRLALPAPPPRTPEGVAAMLGAAVGREVRPDDYVWEERGGAVSELLLGRSVLFLARDGLALADGPSADLFRARVRLTRAGRPIRVSRLRNLSQSPLGDDRDLLARGRYASYATVAHGVVQGITLLDLAGEGASRRAEGRWEHLGAAIEAWLATGSLEGIGRVEVTFGVLPTEIKQELTSDLLVMALGGEAVPAAIDLRQGTLNTGPRNVFAARSQPIPHLSRPLSEVAVTVARTFVGDRTGDAVEALARQLQRPPPPSPSPVVFSGRSPPAPIAPVDDWPPPPLQPELQPALPGEGIWGAAPTEFVAQPEGELSPVFETAIRPSKQRPDVLVRLVALDLRRLDLKLQPGFVHPHAKTGLRGYGRLPTGPEAEAVMLAFMAGPPSKASPNPLGFAADSQVFVPPSPGAASAALARDGGLALGAWPFSAELPAHLEGLFQTPAPLMGGDPRLATTPLEDASIRTERSALCLLASGHAIVAWSANIDAPLLATALTSAGCVYALPLAAGPAPSGLTYLRAPMGAEQAWHARLLAPEMRLAPESLATGSTNPFIYATRRSALPSARLPTIVAEGDSASAPAAATWVAEAGKQPTPTWIPAIHTAVVSNLGAQVHLTTFAPGRLQFRMRAGSKEPTSRATPPLPGALPETEQGRVLVAIGLGFGRRKTARGLAIDGTLGFPFRNDTAGVLLLDKGRPFVLPAEGFKLPNGADATQLPLTADHGKLRPEAREVGSMRARAAVCVLADGTFSLAATTFDSDEATTQALLDVGCARVVALDRGAHAPAFTHRAGGETPPVPPYEPTVLDGLDVPMPGRATQLVAPAPSLGD